MFDEPNETPEERAIDPAQRAKEKAEEFRIHAEIFAVFEGPRKFDAAIHTAGHDALMRDLQRKIAKLDKSKSADSPVIAKESAVEAADVLTMPATADLMPNDYYVHRRPGEVLIARWLEGEGVETFYERLQAHFDAAMTDFREEEKQSHGWKQDAKTEAYLKALDEGEVKMAERYARDAVLKHGLIVLSTLTADEMDILHLCDYTMGRPAAEVVGEASAPQDESNEAERAWFFKLFSLRGVIDKVERMCFFAYLQRTEGESW